MPTRTLFASLAFTAFSLVRTQSGSTTALEPLASKHIPFADLPYQVTGDNGGERGPQFGYNLCNSTTQNQQSLCQTLIVNDLSDFCMWSSSMTDDTVGESEAREVAWCTQPTHGTRTIPPGTITGAQFLYAKNYMQVVGFLNQSQVGLDPSDEGGELDPHGADEQGNPLGGVVYTNGLGSNSASFQAAFNGHKNESVQYTQLIEWVDFIGSGIFCLKLCSPSDPDAPNLCAHIYDEIGCNYNAIADYNAINGTFSVCDSDDMADPGVFSTDGQLTTWFQPQPGPVTTIPYTTTIPASSNCVTYQSSDLFAAAATLFPSASTSGSTSASTSGGSGSRSSGASSSRTGSSSTASATTTSSAAVSVGISLFGLPMITMILFGVMHVMV